MLHHDAVIIRKYFVALVIALASFDITPAHAVTRTAFLTAGATDLAGKPAVPFRSSFDVATTPGAILSGTINYTGPSGPVSETRPILIHVFTDKNFHSESIATLAVTTNGGSFHFQVPFLGDYYLGYGLDLNNNGYVSIGEPFEIYNNQFTFPATPITVPASGASVTLDFDDSHLLPGIAGSVKYTGDYPVSSGSGIVIQAFSDDKLTDTVDDQEVGRSSGRYEFNMLDTSPRYLLAFLDVSGNHQFDSGEPFEIYNERGTVPGDPVTPGPTQTGVNIVFGDQPPSQRLTGTINYTGSKGTVSINASILVYMFNADTPDDNTDVDQAIVSTNGGAFALGAPAMGNYYLAYVLDLDNDGEPSVGEPAGIYNGKSNFPGDPIHVPGSAGNLSFGETLLSGVAGRVKYRGQQGQVSSQTPIIVEAFSDALLLSRTDDTEVHTNGGRFNFVTLDTNTYYLRAFFDTNGNRTWDQGEPFEVYNNKGSGQGADRVVAGPNQTAIDITFGDQPPAAHISGTITYSGFKGPVSNTKPIVLGIINSDTARDRTTVATNGGAFDLGLPASGSYNFAYFLDLNNNGEGDVGEPFQIYNDKFTPPGDTVTATASGLVLSFNDDHLLSGVSGVATYTGHQGEVSADQPLRIEEFTDWNLKGEPDNDARVDTNGGTYSIVLFDVSTCYLRTYLDSNDNDQLDPGEPYTIYNSRANTPADPVATGTTLNLRFGDENVSTPGACVGDCNSDQTVTIDDILTLVNIALGKRSVSDCQAGDFNGDGQVTIDEILRAVNAALSGCAVSLAEQGCLTSGGTVTSAMCCTSSGDFPNTCATGACGCGPGASHEVRICDCGAGSCFDGSGCVRP